MLKLYMYVFIEPEHRCTKIFINDQVLIIPWLIACALCDITIATTLTLYLVNSILRHCCNISSSMARYLEELSDRVYAYGERRQQAHRKYATSYSHTWTFHWSSLSVVVANGLLTASFTILHLSTFLSLVRSRHIARCDNIIIILPSPQACTWSSITR